MTTILELAGLRKSYPGVAALKPVDLAFREDECRVRTGHAAENFAVLRHIALNLLRRDTSVKAGIRAKRQEAFQE